MLFAGMLVTLIVLFGVVYDAFRSSEISVGSDVGASSPFSAPFNVKNVSWLFAMSDTQMRCGLDQVVLASSMQFKNVFLVSPQATIKPGKEGAFRCAIGGEQNDLLQVTPFSLKSARMFLSMHYRILWVIPRASEPVEFTWYTTASPPRWIRGVIAN
jgi:hypothetical protein